MLTSTNWTLVHHSAYVWTCFEIWVFMCRWLFSIRANDKCAIRRVSNRVWSSLLHIWLRFCRSSLMSSSSLDHKQNEKEMKTTLLPLMSFHVNAKSEDHILVEDQLLLWCWFLMLIRDVRRHQYLCISNLAKNYFCPLHIWRQSNYLALMVIPIRPDISVGILDGSTLQRSWIVFSLVKTALVLLPTIIFPYDRLNISTKSLVFLAFSHSVFFLSSSIEFLTFLP